MIFVSLFLASLCVTVSRSSHVSANGTDVFLFMPGCCSIVCMHHLFILSSADGRSGGFRVLAIVYSAAVNVGVHVSFQIMLSPGVWPGGGLLDHTVVLYSVL